MQHLRPFIKAAGAVGVFALVTLGASCGTPADGGIFLSSDNGETWEQRVYVGQEKKKVITISDVNVENIFFDPQNADVMYIASKDNGLFKSINAGESWGQLPVSGERIRDIGINAVDTNVLYVTLNATIIKSSDAGEHWETVYTDPRSATILRVEPDWFNPSRVFATTSIGNIILSEDAGINWSTIFETDEPLSDFVIDPVDSRVMYAVELDRNIHKSIDGGETWKPLVTTTTVWSKSVAAASSDPAAEEDIIGRKPTSFRSLIMDPNDNDHLFLLSPQGILHSLNGGVSWSYINTLIALDAPENASIRSFIVVPNSPETYLFSLGRIFHKSTNASTSWKTIENFPSGRIVTVLAVSPLAPDRVFAGTEALPKKGGLFGL